MHYSSPQHCGCRNKWEGLALHVSERFLREKDTDPLGRPIPDFLHSKIGTPPNLRATIAEQWGTIEHPDITTTQAAYKKLS